MKIKCKICKKEVEGRADKKFCSVACKNYYHIHLRYASVKAALRINEYFKRNQGLLLELIGKNKNQIKVYRNELEDKKFRFIPIAIGTIHTRTQIVKEKRFTTSMI